MAWLLAAAVIGVLVTATVALLVPAMVDRVSKSIRAARLADGLRGLALILTALTLGYAMAPRAPWQTTGPLPGYAGTVTKLFGVQVVLLIALAAVVASQRRHCPGALFRGFGTPIVASLALGLGVAMSAGVSYRAADLLDGNAVPSPAEFGTAPALLRLQPPVSYQWAAFGYFWLGVIVVLAVLWTRYVIRPALSRQAQADTDGDFPGGRQRDPRRAAQLDRAVAEARLTDHISGPLGVACLILAVGAAGATLFALADVGPVQLAPSGSGAARALSVVTNAGTYLISVSVVGLVLLGVQTYRNQRVRSTVGVIWDLATFWPRASQPLAPPCYAERVVPELVHRSSWLAGQPGGVLLSGHSQGSVLLAATVLQLSPAAAARTALLTYGSPLSRLYRRAFPHLLGDRVLAQVAAAVTAPDGTPRWVNLWRRTDPIGGPIGAAIGAGDRRLADPVSFDPLPGDRQPPAVAGHSDYQQAQQFSQAVSDLAGLLRRGPTAHR
jgi:hypothetical protein